MLSPGDAGRVAARFGLGDDARLTGPVARGELGQVWRIETERGCWAVKEPFEPPSPVEVADDAAYQAVVRADGVAMPAIVHAADGNVLARVGSAIVRVYEWVDLLPVDRHLDPHRVGQLIAAIHRVRHHGPSPVDPWYTDRVGADRWDELTVALTAAGAPFAEALGAHRGELACRRWLDPTGDRQRSADHVEELLGEPITRQLIDALLDAIAT